MVRESIVPCEVLSNSERVEGLDVFRLLTSDIEKLIERENELFNTSEPSHKFRVTHVFYVH